MTECRPMLGRRVRSLLAAEEMNAWDVQAHSERRISHMTVRKMMKGFPPGTDHIVEFAETMGKALEWTPAQTKELADELLELANSRVRYHLGVIYAVAA